MYEWLTQRRYIVTFLTFQAAGLGFYDIAKEILDRYPPTVDASNHEGRTPLHYAAAQKDDGAMYDLLMEYGADGSKLDNVRIL